MLKNEEATAKGPSHEEEEEEESEDGESFDVTHTLLPEIFAQGTISKGWCPVNGLPSLLAKRLLNSSLLDSIGKSTSCHIAPGADTAFLTVKGDNDQAVTQAVGNLDNLAKALVSIFLCAYTSYSTDFGSFFFASHLYSMSS